MVGSGEVVVDASRATNRIGSSASAPERMHGTYLGPDEAGGAAQMR